MKSIFGVDHEALSWVCVISGFGGVAYHLWRGNSITLKRFVGAVMLSMLAGGLAFMWLWEAQTAVSTKVFVVAVLAGVGATTILDLVVAFLYKQGPQWIRNVISDGWK